MDTEENRRKTLPELQQPLLGLEKISEKGETKAKKLKRQKREGQRRWIAKNPDYQRQWRERNPDYSRLYLQRPEQKSYHKKYAASYYSDSDKGDFRQQRAKRSHQKWCATHPRCEKRKEYFQMIDSKNKDRKRQQARERGKTIRLAAFEAYGGHKCKCCGEDVYEFLCLDHINNDGRKHREEVGANGTSFYYHLKKRGFPDVGLQILCHSCNMAKQFYGTCPHQQMKTPIDLFFEQLQ